MPVFNRPLWLIELVIRWPYIGTKYYKKRGVISPEYEYYIFIYKFNNVLLYMNSQTVPELSLHRNCRRFSSVVCIQLPMGEF